MENNIQPALLIAPKTLRPSPSSHYLHRKRLIDELNSQQHCPLIVITGPAGYGKSTLMSAWLAEMKWPTAWLSLDQGDNDLRLFVRYLVAAIQEIFPKAMKKTAALLRSVMLPDDTILGKTLINELDQIDSPYTVALDDYHLIKEGAIHKLIGQIVRYPPRTFHLVIASRYDPPLPLSTLMAHGKMAQIRTDELRFTKEEAAMMLERVSGSALSASTASILTEQLDGWAAGLHVAGLTLRHKPATLTLKPLSITTHSSVMQYLFDEVLQQQPAQVQEFLIKTSILDELTQPLCDAVMGQESMNCGDEPCPCLSYVVQRNLFVIGINEGGGEYRYHHLFQELLRRQLKERYNASEIAKLHGRASDWHAEHGQPDEALRYALQVKDYARASRVISRHRLQLMNDDDWLRLEHMLVQIPREVLNATPDLLLIETWIANVRYHRNEVLELLKQVDSLIDVMPETPERNLLKSESASLRSQYWFGFSEIAKAHEDARQGLRFLPHDHWHGLSVAWLIETCATLVDGDRAQAFELIYRALESLRNKGNGFWLRLMVVLCFMHDYAGNFSELKQAATEVLEVASHSESVEQKLSNSLNWARYHLGLAHYYRNELAEAGAVLSIVVAQRYESNLDCTVQSMFILALMHQAQGRPDVANQLADLASLHALEMSGTILLPVIDVFKAHLALQQGRINEAYQRVANLSLPELLPPLWKFYTHYLTYTKVHLAVGVPESLEKAEAMLKRLHTHAEQQHNPRMVIEVLAQQALLADVKHDQRTALMLLEQALVLAEPQNIIRIFADHGPRMADLLVRVHSRSVSPKYCQRILEAFGTDRKEELFPTQERLIEPLTNREIEVLGLLHKRLRNKEIADSLYISTGTVKRHIHAIYEKLDVTSRRDAVIKALDLNLLNYD